MYKNINTKFIKTSVIISVSVKAPDDIAFVRNNECVAFEPPLCSIDVRFEI